MVVFSIRFLFFISGCQHALHLLLLFKVGMWLGTRNVVPVLGIPSGPNALWKLSHTDVVQSIYSLHAWIYIIFLCGNMTILCEKVC